MVIQQAKLDSYNCDEIIDLVNEIFTGIFFPFKTGDQHEQVYHMFKACFLDLFLYFDLCNNLSHDCSVNITIQK